MSYDWGKLIMKARLFRPMLAAGRDHDMTMEMWLSKIKFPVIATPKIDGIRCITLEPPEKSGWTCRPVCRSLKPVPNLAIFTAIATKCPAALDGELVTYQPADLLSGGGPKPFNGVQSDIMSVNGTPEFRYLIFDHGFLGEGQTREYITRLRLLETLELPDFCQVVPPVLIKSLDDLNVYEEAQILAGHEGICFRRPDSPYKHGRSTMKEGWLVKMKRMETEEAGIIEVCELMTNNNPVTESCLGYAERSSHKHNMTPAGVMGKLICRSDKWPEPFGVGTGFTARDRELLWSQRDSLIGKTIVFRHQPHGSKGAAPRLPAFVGFRDQRDL